MANSLRTGILIAIIALTARLGTADALKPEADQGKSFDAPRSLDLGYWISGHAIDPAGKSMLVWGRKNPLRNYNPAADAAAPTDLALIDLDGMKVLTIFAAEGKVSVACLDDRYIYLVLANGDDLQRLDRADPAKRKLLRLPNTKSRIQPLPAGKLAVMYGLQYNLGGIVVYDRETLTPNPEHFAQVEQGDSANDSTEIAEQGIDGTLVTHDQFVDAATGEVRSARELCPLPLLADVVWPAPAILRSKPRIYLWARTILLRRRMDQQPFITIDTLATAAGTQIAEVRQAAAISPFQPFAVNLSLKPGGKGIDGTLEFRELKRGKVIGSAELGKLNGRYSDYNDRIRPQLLLTKEDVVVVDYDRIVSAAIPADVKTKLAAPLALKIPKIPVASVDRPVEVQFEAHGDSNGRTFSLSRETPGLSMDAATGKLTVDLPKIWKKHTDVGGLSESLLPAVRQPKIDVSAIFRRLTSSPLPPGKTAFRLPLRVTVANAAGETDELRLAMVVVAPKDEADKAEAELADLAAERDERYRRQEAASRAGVASVGFPPRADVEARLAQLEMRARRIEASLDAAIEKFDRMEKSLNGGEKGVPANEPPSPSGHGP